MIDFADFDILAHLTCPLRYIVGKYKIDIELSRYVDKIETILKKIIKKYYDLGGYLITFGSDAHVAENASCGFDEAIENVKKSV